MNYQDGEQQQQQQHQNEAEHLVCNQMNFDAAQFKVENKVNCVEYVPCLIYQTSTNTHSFLDRKRTVKISELTNKRKKITKKKITMLFNVIRCAYVEHFFQNITNDIINNN